MQVVLTTGVDYWWSIDELHLYTTDCSRRLRRRSTALAGRQQQYRVRGRDARPLRSTATYRQRFSSNKDQAAGMVFKVDLGAPQSFDELVMATPNSPNDYARVFNVGVSNDGTSWSTVATCKGSSASQVVRFPAQTARYLRVVLDQGTAANYWWSIAGVQRVHQWSRAADHDHNVDHHNNRAPPHHAYCFGLAVGQPGNRQQRGDLHGQRGSRT